MYIVFELRRRCLGRINIEITCSLQHQPDSPWGGLQVSPGAAWGQGGWDPAALWRSGRFTPSAPRLFCALPRPHADGKVHGWCVLPYHWVLFVIDNRDAWEGEVQQPCILWSVAMTLPLPDHQTDQPPSSSLRLQKYASHLFIFFIFMSHESVF